MNVADEAQNDVQPCFADAVYSSQPPISTRLQLVPSTKSICTINSGAFMRTYTVVKFAPNVKTMNKLGYILKHQKFRHCKINIMNS